MTSNEIAAMMEDDSWLRDSPPSVVERVTKPVKRAKALNIDDLFKDHRKEKLRRLVPGAKRERFVDSDSSDDERPSEKTQKELEFETLVETCEKQLHEGAAMNEVPKWGHRIFGPPRLNDDIAAPKLGGLAVQASAASRSLSCRSLLESGQEDDSNEETVAMELLTSDWLLPLGLSLGRCDDATLGWVFHHMVNSSDKNVERAACDFLCQFILSQSQVQRRSFEINWLPSFERIVTIFKFYGYLGISAEGEQFSSEQIAGGIEAVGLPHNLGSLLKFLTICFETRQFYEAFLASEAENLLVIIITFLLDRRLLIYTILIQKCLESILNYFTDKEWDTSRERIAILISRFDMHTVNYLRLIRCLRSLENRMKQLQKDVALHLLSKSAGCRTVPNGPLEVTSIFSRADLKNNETDFVQLYFQLFLADICLWSDPMLKSDQAALESWLLFLKTCSCQISSTDWRPHASKVRNWSSYLLQSYEVYQQSEDFEES